MNNNIPAKSSEALDVQALNAPVFDISSARSLILESYGLEVTKIDELHSHYDKNYFVNVDSKWENPNVQSLHEHGYVLKIHNGYAPLIIEEQHSVLNHLRRHNIVTQEVVPTKNGYLFVEVWIEDSNTGDRVKYTVELRTYLPGRVIKEVPYSAYLLSQAGRLVANTRKALEDFERTVTTKAKNRIFSLLSVPGLKQFAHLVPCQGKEAVEDAIALYEATVLNNYDRLPKGYIHGDLNEHNVLVSRNASDNDYNICGVLDTAEFEYSFPVFDLTITMAYLMIDSDVVDQLDTPGYILSGYLSVRSLTEAEWSVLVPCIAGRLAASLTLGAYAHNLHPENAYTVCSSEKKLSLLRALLVAPREELLMKWRSIAKQFNY